MTEREQKEACSLLDTHYGYIRDHAPCDLELENAYYDGMKTMIECILLGTDFCLVREDNGRHFIEPEQIPF